MMGMFVVHGAQAGGFSPISIYGTITNSVMEDAGLPSSEITVFLASLVVNTVMAVDPLPRPRWSPADGDARRNRPRTTPTPSRRGPAPRRRHRAGPRHRHHRPPTSTQAVGVRHDQLLTLVAFVAVALVALAFDKNIGFVSITAAVILAMLAPNEHKDAAQADRLAHRAAGRRCQHLRDPSSPTARLPGVRRQLGRRPRRRRRRTSCSATSVASSRRSRRRRPCCPSSFPIAVPLIRQRRHRRAARLIAALAISLAIVDVSPFSTNGALMLANRPDSHQRTGLLQADPHLQRHRGRRRPVARVGRPDPPRMVTE